MVSVNDYQIVAVQHRRVAQVVTAALCAAVFWVLTAALLGDIAPGLLPVVVLAFITGARRGVVRAGRDQTEIDPTHALIVGASMAFGSQGGALTAVFSGLGRISRTNTAGSSLNALTGPLPAVAGSIVFRSVSVTLGWGDMAYVPAAVAAIAVYGSSVYLLQFFVSNALSIAFGTVPTLRSILLSSAAGYLFFFAFASSPVPAALGLILAVVAAGIRIPQHSTTTVDNEEVADSLTLIDSSEPESVSLDAGDDNSESGRSGMLDPLTRAANIRYLLMFLNQEINRSERKSHPLSLLLFDVDNLESINRECGRETGDNILQEIASYLKNALREYDLVARYAGDEFAVVLPETAAENALEIAERIHTSLTGQKDYTFEGNSISLSMSVGVASFPDHGSSVDELVSSAHHALNRAKFSGSNRVCSCHKLAKAG